MKTSETIWMWRDSTAGFLPWVWGFTRKKCVESAALHVNRRDGQPVLVTITPARPARRRTARVGTKGKR